MARKIKQNIDVKVISDTREKSTGYIKQIKTDLRRGKDKIKLIGVETETVRPCKNSTKSIGDITFKYCFPDDDPDEWIQANFSIERKGSTDEFSSIYTKANRDRLVREMDNAVEGGVDIYFVVTDDVTVLNKKIQAIRKFNESTCITFFTNMLKFNEVLMNHKIPFITSGQNFGWIIRRLIKHHIQKYKLQYK